jgi:hypothetical protein
MEDLKFNTDISSYKLEELFSMLDIKITDTSDLTNIKTLIVERTDKYIDQFTKANRKGIADFFKTVKMELLGNSADGVLTSAQQLLVSYDKSYNPLAKIQQSNGSESLYESNGGSGNPINRKTVSKLLNIDSRFRKNYSSTSATDYLIDLPYEMNNVIEVKLCDLELPSTFYPITTEKFNNYFWYATYTEDQVINSNPNIYYMHIKDGNYYFDNLIVDMNKLFKSTSTSDIPGYLFDLLPISITFDLNYNNLGGVGNGTGKVSIGTFAARDISLNLTQNIVKIELNFESPPIPNFTESTRILDPDLKRLYYIKSPIPLEQRFGWMLGFREGYYGRTDGSVMYHVSESVLNILGPRYLFLIVNDFNKSNNVNFISTSKYGLLPDNIMARVSIKGPAFSILAQNDYSVYAEPRYYFGPVNISKIQIKLVDEFSRLVDLNNSDFSFTLRMTTIYSAT